MNELLTRRGIGLPEEREECDKFITLCAGGNCPTVDNLTSDT